MKKTISIFLTVIMLLLLTACGSRTTGNPGHAGQSQTSNQTTALETTATNESTPLTEADAIGLVLEKVPGSTEDQIIIKADRDDGRNVFEGELRFNGMEYDFEIDADTGVFLEWEEDRID